MKIQIMTGLLALGLIAGCATDDDMDNGTIEESAGAATSPGMGTEFNELPAAVQQSVRTHSPNARIDDIDKETRSGRVVYEIKFDEPGENPALHVAEDGTILSKE